MSLSNYATEGMLAALNNEVCDLRKSSLIQTICGQKHSPRASTHISVSYKIYLKGMFVESVKMSVGNTILLWSAEGQDVDNSTIKPLGCIQK